MSSPKTTVSCPHCKREYTLHVSLDRLARLKKMATCTRCGKRFDIASRLLGRQDEPDIDDILVPVPEDESEAPPEPVVESEPADVHTPATAAELTSSEPSKESARDELLGQLEDLRPTAAGSLSTAGGLELPYEPSKAGAALSAILRRDS